MNRLRNFVRCGVKCGFVVLLLCGLSPAIASAHSVRGHGRVPEPEPLLDSLISVDAWLDASGEPQGSMVWVGDVIPSTPGGPAVPWFIEVTDIVFNGNSATVTGVVVHSVFPSDIGTIVIHTFTDNSGTGMADEIDGVPIVAGNITVVD